MTDPSAKAREINPFGKCPECGAYWTIPAELPLTLPKFSRLIGLSDGDRIHTWKCPDCKTEWPR